MAEWMLILIDDDDRFGESLARATKHIAVYAFLVGCLVGAGVVWLVSG
jgi:ActR/RegA family two-component response regulator